MTSLTTSNSSYKLAPEFRISKPVQKHLDKTVDDLNNHRKTVSNDLMTELQKSTTLPLDVIKRYIDARVGIGLESNPKSPSDTQSPPIIMPQSHHGSIASWTPDINRGLCTPSISSIEGTTYRGICNAISPPRNRPAGGIGSSVIVTIEQVDIPGMDQDLDHPIDNVDNLGSADRNQTPTPVTCRSAVSQSNTNQDGIIDTTTEHSMTELHGDDDFSGMVEMDAGDACAMMHGTYMASEDFAHNGPEEEGYDSSLSGEHMVVGGSTQGSIGIDEQLMAEAGVDTNAIERENMDVQQECTDLGSSVSAFSSSVTATEPQQQIEDELSTFFKNMTLERKIDTINCLFRGMGRPVKKPHQKQGKVLRPSAKDTVEANLKIWWEERTLQLKQSEKRKHATAQAEAKKLETIAQAKYIAGQVPLSLEPRMLKELR